MEEKFQELFENCCGIKRNKDPNISIIYKLTKKSNIFEPDDIILRRISTLPTSKILSLRDFAETNKNKYTGEDRTVIDTFLEVSLYIFMLPDGRIT